MGVPPFPKDLCPPLKGLQTGGQIIQGHVVKHKIINLPLPLGLNDPVDRLRLPLRAHEHEAAVGRDLPQPGAQGQTKADILGAVLSHLQQRSSIIPIPLYMGCLALL